MQGDHVSSGVALSPSDAAARGVLRWYSHYQVVAHHLVTTDLLMVQGQLVILTWTISDILRFGTYHLLMSRHQMTTYHLASPDHLAIISVGFYLISSASWNSCRTSRNDRLRSSGDHASPGDVTNGRSLTNSTFRTISHGAPELYLRMSCKPLSKKTGY